MKQPPESTDAARYAGVATVTIVLPLAEPPDNQTLRIGAHRVDCQLRDRETCEALMSLRAGLDGAGDSPEGRQTRYDLFRHGAVHR